MRGPGGTSERPVEQAFFATFVAGSKGRADAQKLVEDGGSYPFPKVGCLGGQLADPLFLALPHRRLQLLLEVLDLQLQSHVLWLRH